jgi:hypothetical protein
MRNGDCPVRNFGVYLLLSYALYSDVFMSSSRVTILFRIGRATRAECSSANVFLNINSSCTVFVCL